MEKQFGSGYREQIEALSESEDFEKEGDAIFLSHEDPEARLLWAFYRPSGSHPSQIADSAPEVAAMGFAHSRLGALERFRLLNPVVLQRADLRQKISKRARMLFRALADDDFVEMATVVSEFSGYAALSVDQLINGRKMIEEVELCVKSVNDYLYLVEEFWSENAFNALYARFRPRSGYTEETVSQFGKKLKSLEKIHPVLVEIFSIAAKEAEGVATHPLKKMAIKKLSNDIQNGIRNGI